MVHCRYITPVRYIMTNFRTCFLYNILVLKRNEVYILVLRCRKPLGLDGQLFIRSATCRTTAATMQRRSFFDFFTTDIDFFPAPFFVVMPPPDPRHVPGSIVHAKAFHVKNLAECTRRYGSLNKEKDVQGVVVNAKKERKEGAARGQWMITADYDFGEGDIVTKKLTKKLVTAGPVPVSEDNQEESSAPLSSARPSSTTETSPQGQANSTSVVAAATADTAATNAHPPTNQGGETPRATQLLGNNNHQEHEAANNEQSTQGLPQQLPAVVAHGLQWWDDPMATKIPIGGAYSNTEWHLRDSIGNVFRKGSNRHNRMTKLEYFLLMFPPMQLDEMVRLTNLRLEAKDYSETTKTEIVKWMGILLLITRFEFRTRKLLWSTTPQGKYRAAPCFGKTGMSRNRFTELTSCMRWSDQPDVPHEGMSAEQHRWLLVDGFVERFNQHRENTFFPSWTICVDESMSRWYGIGGHWIESGLPMYVAIDRKPENGCEIQNVAKAVLC